MASSNSSASTQSAANKGPNIPKQDIPDINLKTSNILLLIAKLSPQTNSKAIEQLELRAL